MANITITHLELLFGKLRSICPKRTVMKTFNPFSKKSYAMQRMGAAIQRAIAVPTVQQKLRAAKWAAAWGLLCGINVTDAQLRPGHSLGGRQESGHSDKRHA